MTDRRRNPTKKLPKSEAKEKNMVTIEKEIHLFPSRTQKLSSSAAIILRKWESSTVPDYIKTIRKGGFYFWLTCLVPLSVSGKTTDCPMALRGFYETKAPRSLLRFVTAQ